MILSWEKKQTNIELKKNPALLLGMSYAPATYK
jgi:hypothetical protein